MEVLAVPATVDTSSRLSGYWQAADEWRAPDGSVGLLQRLIRIGRLVDDAAQRWPGHQITAPRFTKLKKKGRRWDADKVPGRIRCVRVQDAPGPGPTRVWVYHAGDVRECAQVVPCKNAYEAAAQGVETRDGNRLLPLRAAWKYLNKKVKELSRARKVRRAPIPCNRLPGYHAKGCPFWTDKRGRPRRLYAEQHKQGDYGREVDHYSTRHLDEIAEAYVSLSETPGEAEGLVLTAESGLWPSEPARLHEAGELPKPVKRLGVDKTGRLCRRSLLPGDLLTNHRIARTRDDRPAGFWTIEEWAVRLGIKKHIVTNHLTAGTMHAVKHKIPVRSGGAWRRRPVRLISAGEAKRFWKKVRPGRPFPELPRAAGSRAAPLPRRGKAGRPRKEETKKEHLRFSYEAYHDVEVTLDEWVREAEHRFPNLSWEAATLRIYAKRWAELKGLEFRPRTEQKTLEK